MTSASKPRPPLARFTRSNVVASALAALAACCGTVPGRAATDGAATTAPGDGATSDLGEYLLGRCHVTGIFESASIAERPWSNAVAEGLGPSVLVEVRWRGEFTGKPYRSLFAMVHAKAPKTGMSTWVLEDDSPFGALPGCSLMLGPTAVSRP